MPKLTNPKKKVVKKSKISAVKKKKLKTPSLYSQLRKQIYSEEKFFLLREKDPSLKWDQVSNLKASFAQSQQINKRTNLALQELRQIRENRIKDYQEKTSWSLRKQRAKIRRVRGKIDEIVYQKKLQQLLNFKEKKSNYKGKLAREQFWSKKFQVSPISLAQAELTKPRIQPDHAPSNDLAVLKFRVFRSKSIPAEAWDQPWLSHKERKTAQFSTLFSSPALRKIETTREPLITDKLKEYQYKLNFYQLFGRPPHTQKEIRKFASIDWEKEKDNYWAFYGFLTRHEANKRREEELREIRGKAFVGMSLSEREKELLSGESRNLIIHPLDDKLWTQTQKNILAWGRDRYYWALKGNKDGSHLSLFSSRSEQAKFFQSPRQTQEIWFLEHYDRQYLEQNKERLIVIKKRLSSRWEGEIERIKSAHPSWNIKSYGQGLSANLVLATCSPKCNCGTNSYCDPTGSEPACYIGYEFSADNHWIPNKHPPLAPRQCPYLNTSHFDREEYGKPNRWVQCGKIKPLEGEKWHHLFDAWHRGSGGWGCHFSFPPEGGRKKQKSRSTIVEMEW